MVLNNKRLTIILFMWALFSAPASAMEVVDVDSLMNTLYTRVENKGFSFGECKGKLYVKQYANLYSWNIALNWIPGMTRFDRDENFYLSELFYDVRFFDYALPIVRRMAYLTTHKRGNGEMERVLSFMSPAIYSEKLLKNGYLSPLNRAYKSFYIFEVDTSYTANNPLNLRIKFNHRFDNIKLLNSGWFVLDDSCAVRELYIEGWDEQSTFDVHYRLGDKPPFKNLIKDVRLNIRYDFGGNRLDVAAEGVYDYTQVQSLPKVEERKEVYDLSIEINNDTVSKTVSDKVGYATSNRKIELTSQDSLLYIKKNVIADTVSHRDDSLDVDRTANILWEIGDQMLSAHSLDWEGGRIKLSPILNPSYLSYSSSKGLSYKMSLNLKNEFKNGHYLSLKPMGGYSFKQGVFYWDINGTYIFAPMYLGLINIDVGSDNRSYSSVALERIEKVATEVLDFKELNLNYFRHTYVYASLQRELSNGLELLLGINFHRRSLIGSMANEVVEAGIPLKSIYRQIAPHARLTWQPGMYYYIKNGRKINIGSRKPRFSFDVEQGLKGVFGSSGIYTRAEFDIQYNYRLNSVDRLHFRVGGGGFFYTKDVYFADYAFLKHNYLPVDRSDELGGVFQLLDSEWYNAANKYMRGHITYESPFFVLQRALPRVSFLKNERLYGNILFISHLTPYVELGYGVETPYVDMGVFVSGKNHKFHGVGYKITVSLFRD